jgi:hypothetical protein
MMKKRKFGAGGASSTGATIASSNRVAKQVGAETKELMGVGPKPKKKPMPTPADIAVSKAQNEMLKNAKVTRSEAATLASAARASKENAKDLKAVTKAKGGKVKRKTR